MNSAALVLEEVHFSYLLHGREVPALNGINLTIAAGEMVAIQGPSGSGKSTLLYILGCMLNPQKGRVTVLGQEVQSLNDTELAFIRNRWLGFVFQQFYLINSANILQNILLPTRYPVEAPKDSQDWQAKATALAGKLGLSDRLLHKPQQLSGGQQQRVAIARALIRDPKIILADEPTGNLDSQSSKQTLTLLRDLNKEGRTVIIITHDNEVAAQCDRVILVRDGRVIETPSTRTPQSGVGAVQKEPLPKFREPSLISVWRESLSEAYANVNRNRTRSLLTLLGVMVGVAAVVSMLTLGLFTQKKVLQSYATLGVHTLAFEADVNWFMRARDKTGRAFSGLHMERDVLPLQKYFPEIKRLSPQYTSYGHSVLFGGRSIDGQASLAGVSDAFLAITQRKLASGSNIQSYHVANKSSVCLIGFGIVEKLFPRQSPIGEIVQFTINELTIGCRVIGVLAKTFSRNQTFQPDMQILVPHSFFQTLPVPYWTAMLRNLVMEIDMAASVLTTGQKLQALFENRYKKSGRFSASSDSQLVSQMQKFLNLFTLLLGGIAAVTLVVGGMGIANMMLVSVNERLREIGLRKALGASHQAVRHLFFSETLALCLFAGILGVGLGFVVYESLIYVGSLFITDLKFEWLVEPIAIFIAFGAILATGFLSGLAPAVKAERLSVVEALRSE